MGEGARRWVVICGAKAGCGLVTALADCVIERDVDWAQDQLQSFRQYTGLEPSSDFSKWGEVKRTLERMPKRPRFPGRFKGTEGGARLEALKAIFAARAQDNVEGLILSKDTDGLTERMSGMRQATDEHSLPTCFAVAHPEREAWLLHGFDPRNDDEKSVLDKIKKSIGFDPPLKAERLNPKRTHTQDGKPIAKSTKLIVEKLTKNNKERERACWTDAPLQSLIERGERTGLRDYCEDVQRKLVPQLT